MARINLLPWRQEERQRKNKEFLTLAFAVFLLTAVVLGAIWFFVDSQLQAQNRANELINQENQRLDTVLVEIADLEQRRDDIISRMKVIQDLQGHRPIPVHVWDDLARAIPNAMYLTNLKREGDVLTLTGYADNPNVVSNLIRNLDSSDWMGNSAVLSIQKNISPYQAPSADNNPKEEKIVYPESSYSQFIVTTNVQATPTNPDTAGINSDADDPSLQIESNELEKVSIEADNSGNKEVITIQSEDTPADPNSTTDNTAPQTSGGNSQ